MLCIWSFSIVAQKSKLIAKISFYRAATQGNFNQETIRSLKNYFRGFDETKPQIEAFQKYAKQNQRPEVRRNTLFKS